MPTETANWSTAQSTAQYRAVAWLRWRILINNFRHKVRGSEIFASILLVPALGAIIIGPTVAAGFGAWYFISTGHFDRIAWILWGAFAFCQFLNIQIGQPGTTFDPTQLIRFPLRVSDYIAIRLFFGLLSPANIASFFIALAVAIGVTVELPHLWLYTFIALFLFFAVNVLFSRMVFSWVDRWLSTRRAREVFTACIFIFSLGIQWVNFTFNPTYHRHSHHNTLAPEKVAYLTHLYHQALPWLAGFPPNLTSSALRAAQHANVLHAVADIFFIALYAAVFYAIFAWRTRTEYRGENFGSQAGSIKTAPVAVHTTVAVPTLAAPSISADAARAGLTSTISAVLGKDFLAMRRNAGIFYALIAPLLPAFLLIVKNATLFRAEWLLPMSLSVSLLGLAPLSFNTFGLEGAGCQFYFFAPIRIRDVFLAKNILILAVGVMEAVVVYILIAFNTGHPSLRSTVASLLWALATLLICIIFGNRQSIVSPKKIEIGRAAARQSSQASALMAIGLLVACSGIGAALYGAEWYFDTQWLLLPGLIIFFAIAVFAYRSSLNAIDTFAYNNREDLFAELCKN